MSNGELTQLVARLARANGEGDIRVVKRFDSNDNELQAQLEQEIEKRNNAYTERNLCVALVAQLARQLGYLVGLRQHTGEEEWEDEWRTVLFINLPTGQVSWHLHVSELPNFAGLPDYTEEWDGHTTEEKYERVKQFVASLPKTEERPTRVRWTRLDGSTSTFTSHDELHIEERLHGLFLCRMNGKLTDLTIEH